MSAAKRKVNPLTLKEKKAVILEVENSNGRTKSQIAEQFRIPKSTLSTILKEKERILNLNDTDDLGPQRKRMRIRRGVYPQLEEALFAWLQEQTANNQSVSGQRMLARSQELARQLGVDDFKSSVGWLESFKRRHGLTGARPGPADGWRPEPAPDGSVPLAQLPALMDEFAAADVFVVAEMGLVFDLTPAELSAGPAGDCAGGELAERRFSVLAAASADGSQKLPLLVAGEKPVPGGSQPGRLAYRAEPRGWLQPDYFAGWLERRNGEMAAQGRRALFLCEQRPLHVAGPGLDALELACLPPSPLTQAQLAADGVLHGLKRHFRRRVAGWLAEHGRPPAADEALQLLSRAWWHDLDSERVRRFHAATGLLRHEANGQPAPAAAEDGPELAALAGGPFAAPAAAPLADYVTADDALRWAAADPAPATPDGRRSPAAGSERDGSPAAAARDHDGPPPAKPDRQGSPAAKRERQQSPAVKRESQGSPAAKRERQGSPAAKRERLSSPVVKRDRQGSPVSKKERRSSPAGRRRPSSHEALKAVLVLQQYFQLRESDDELDEVLSFVAFTREKIVKLQAQESRHDNGPQKLKKETKAEKPDMLGTIKFDSPILSIDPDVDPEELKEQQEVKPPPPKPGSDLLTPRKGGIRVGPQFQADVPGGPIGELPDTVTDSGLLEQPRWTTEHELTERQVNQFVMLTRAVGMFARACDGSSASSQQGIHVAAANASRDVTRAHALDVLHRHDYRLSSALTSLVPDGGPVLCRDELEDWSVHETAIFEEALSRHGKQFDLVRRDYLPWKTSAQLHEYYYMWKTTDRYVRRRRAKHLARRQAAQMAAPAPREAASPPAAAAPASPAAPAARPAAASDALTLLSPMLNALGTSVSIEPVSSGPRRSPEQRGKAAVVEKLCGGVRLSGECSITPVPLSR